MNHSFDKDIAVAYGLPEAIILNHMQFWIEHNEANKVNYHDGSYWTYNTAKAYAEIFPYLSQRQIQCALKHLRVEGILKTGNYNKSAYDRTLWYAFDEKGISIMQKCKKEDEKMSNPSDAPVQPIPNNNTDNNSDITQKEKTNNNIDYEAEFEKLWSLYPCKRGKSQVSKKAMKELAKAGFDVVSKAIENYKKEVEDIRQTSFNQQWLNGSTFFNGRWKDYVTANEPTFPDGRREVEYEDGSKIIYFPNGKVLDVDPYGLSHELLPHEIEELKEGRYK
jgi:hypothetical protein